MVRTDVNSTTSTGESRTMKRKSREKDYINLGSDKARKVNNSAQTSVSPSLNNIRSSSQSDSVSGKKRKTRLQSNSDKKRMKKLRKDEKSLAKSAMKASELSSSIVHPQTSQLISLGKFVSSLLHIV